MRGPARAAQALYILGDLFDYWIGDAGADDLARKIFAELVALTGRGVATAFMCGNRDYLVGPRAAAAAGFALLPDPTTIDLFGREAVLVHGDTLCTDDISYQRYRRFVHAPLSIATANALPRFVMQWIARSVRAKSESAKQTKPRMLMDVNERAVAAAFIEADVDLMIHGHTHRPAHHRLLVEGRACDRYVLADWYERGSYLQVTPAGIESIDWRG